MYTGWLPKKVDKFSGHIRQGYGVLHRGYTEKILPGYRTYGTCQENSLVVMAVVSQASWSDSKMPSHARRSQVDDGQACAVT